MPSYYQLISSNTKNSIKNNEDTINTKKKHKNTKNKYLSKVAEWEEFIKFQWSWTL